MSLGYGHNALSMKYIKVISLIGLLTIACLMACDSETPLPEGALPEINGGHQASVVDRDIVFHYGLFNVEGEASTTFKKGEEIYFSFWVENKGDIDYGLSRPDLNKFMYVFHKEDIDNAELIGTPFAEFCDQKGVIFPIEKNEIPNSWLFHGIMVREEVSFADIGKVNSLRQAIILLLL